MCWKLSAPGSFVKTRFLPEAKAFFNSPGTKQLLSSSFFVLTADLSERSSHLIMQPMEKVADSVSLKDHFLLAMPSLDQSGFADSITYICEHTEHGAMGIVINRPMNLKLDDVLDQIPIDHLPHEHKPVLAGGPVQMNRGFILHRNCAQTWQSSLAVTEEISLTTSLDILNAIAFDKGPQDCLFALGYAGWSSGQLEQEIADNAWLTVQAEPHILFDTPYEQRLSQAATLLGVDLKLIAPTVGHA